MIIIIGVIGARGLVGSLLVGYDLSNGLAESEGVGAAVEQRLKLMIQRVAAIAREKRAEYACSSDSISACNSSSVRLSPRIDEDEKAERLAGAGRAGVSGRTTAASDV